MPAEGNTDDACDWCSGGTPRPPLHFTAMEGSKREPQLGVHVLIKLGAALRNAAPKQGEGEPPQRMRALLIELQRIEANAAKPKG